MNTTPNPRATKKSRGELDPAPPLLPPGEEDAGGAIPVVEVGDGVAVAVLIVFKCTPNWRCEMF